MIKLDRNEVKYWGIFRVKMSLIIMMANLESLLWVQLWW